MSMASKVELVQFFIFSQAPQETEVQAPPQAPPSTQAPPLDWNQMVEEEEKEKEAAKEPQGQEELDAEMAEMTLEKK